MDYLRILDYDVHEREILEELSWQVPPVQDLIRFAVREAYPVEGIEAQYEEMYGWITAKGFQRYWGERYFEAHWELPPMTRILEALYRGLLEMEHVEAYATIHDFRPDPRPGIPLSDQEIMIQTAYRPIPRVDLRRAWEAGIPGYEDLTPHMRKIGYSPEDAETEAALQVRVALTAEINEMERLVEKRYKAGYIDLEQAEDDLEALDFHPERIDARISYYQLVAETDHADSDLKEIDSAFAKGLVDWADVQTIAEKYIVRAEARQDWLDRIWFKRYKKSRPVEVEVAPLERKIRDMERRIARQELKVQDLVKALEEARINQSETLDTYDVQISALEEEIAEVEAIPISVEGLEAMIRRVTRQIESQELRITALEQEVDEATIIRNETLDTYDVQITYIEEEISLVEAS